MILHIDIETYSQEDLTKCGVYKYAESDSFTITLLAYAFNDDPVQVVDIASGEDIPAIVIAALTNRQYLKKAHNANFERVCIGAFLERTMFAEQWECTMVKCLSLGLPGALGAVAKVLGLSEEKDAEGKTLIRYFAMPCKPTKTNGMRTRNMPADAPEKWARFIVYCGQDVTVERAIDNKLESFIIPESEQRLWCLDQHINDTGILMDVPFIENAIKMDADNRFELLKEAVKLTGLDNPNSAHQLIEWLKEEMPLDDISSLRKDDLPQIKGYADGYINKDNIARVIEIRQDLSKTSIKKYHSMLQYVCKDGRIRGLFQFYGAGTGRWAGRGVQPQNLTKTDVDPKKGFFRGLLHLDIARQLVRANNSEDLDFMYGKISQTLSQLIRTSFIAGANNVLLVADYSAIEARVIAWLANEKWRLEVFATHGKIYEASGAQMFKVPIEAVTKTSQYRAKAKIAELALGYQGAVGALTKMNGALPVKDRIDEDEFPGIVSVWRKANPAITKLWYDMQDAALKAVQENTGTNVLGPVFFYKERNILFMQLPSGRRLAYMRPKIVDGKFGDSLVFEGMNPTTKQWGRQDTYGGKLVENAVQAIARDILKEGMFNVRKAGYNIVLHVHDEIVCEHPASREKGALEDICRLMSIVPEWAKGLPLAADGFVTKYYRKD